MHGDATLFNRSDAVEASWEILRPVLEDWAAPDATTPPADDDSGSGKDGGGGGGGGGGGNDDGGTGGQQFDPNLYESPPQGEPDSGN